MVPLKNIRTEETKAFAAAIMDKTLMSKTYLPGNTIYRLNKVQITLIENYKPMMDEATRRRANETLNDLRGRTDGH